MRQRGEACCGWLKDIATTVVATTSVAVDNVLGTNVTGSIANSGLVPSSQTDNWNTAVTSANNSSLVAGTGATVIGGGIATGSAVATLASGGTSAVVTAPGFIVGATTAAVGAVVTANASKNLAQGNGLINNAGTRRKNRLPDNGPPNSTQANKPSTTTKKYGPNGNVQKEFNEGHQGNNVPKNERSEHVHDYKPDPNNTSSRGERQPGRPPKKNELKKDFNR